MSAGNAEFRWATAIDAILDAVPELPPMVVARVLPALIERDLALEDFLNRRLARGQWSDRFVGPLVLHDQSPVWASRGTERLTNPRAFLIVAAASNVVVDVQVNGTAAFTLTIVAGDTVVETDDDVLVGRDDVVNCKVQAIGTAGADLSVIADRDPA